MTQLIVRPAQSLVTLQQGDQNVFMTVTVVNDDGDVLNHSFRSSIDPSARHPPTVGVVPTSSSQLLAGNSENVTAVMGADQDATPGSYTVTFTVTVTATGEFFHGYWVITVAPPVPEQLPPARVPDDYGEQESLPGWYKF